MVAAGCNYNLLKSFAGNQKVFLGGGFFIRHFLLD